MLTVAAAIGALLVTAVIALLPGAAYASFPVADPYGTDPITEVDGIPLDELPPHTVVRIDTAELPAEAQVNVTGWLEQQPGVDRADTAGPEHFLLVGPDVESATAIDGVVDAYEEQFAQLTDLPSHVPLQWHLRNTGQEIQPGLSGTPNVDISWMFAKERATGAGVTVAVVDSAFDFQHPDLAGSRWVNEGESCSNGEDDTLNGKIDDCQGWNFLRNSNDVATAAEGSDGIDIHGTHVAATITASLTSGDTAGVAPDATIMPLQITEGSAFPVARVAEAVTYAVAEGADVINLSLSSDPGSVSSPALEAAFDYALSEGVFVVAAAGNAGVDIDAADTQVMPASYATEYVNVVAVAATDFNDDLSQFSNYGATTVELSAPGELILSAAPGERYWFMSGTSMAAPVVAATAALVIEHQDPAVADLKGLLIDAAIDAEVAGVAGGVRLNAAAALGIPVIGEGDLEVEADGLVDLDPGVEIVSDITVQAPVGVTPRFTLGIWLDEGAYAVVDHQVALEVVAKGLWSGPTTAEGVVTSPGLDDVDRAALTADGLTYELTTTLPEGRYVLLIDDVQQAPIAPTALFFTVGDLPAIPPPDDGSDADDGVVDEPAVDEPVAEDPDVVDEPAVDDPVGEDPDVVGEPAVDEPVGEDPDVVDEPVVDEPVGEDPDVVDEPVVDEPADGGPDGDPTGGGSNDGSGGSNDGSGGTDGDGGDDPIVSASRLTPSSGPTGVKTVVTIQDSFDIEGDDIPTGVRFGDLRGDLMNVSALELMVATPESDAVGPVDVRIYAGADGDVLIRTYVDGFTFVNEFGDGTTGDGTTGDGGESTGTSPPSDGDDATPPSGGGIDGGELPDAGEPAEPDGLVWPPTVLSNGLTAARFTSRHALGGIVLSHWSSSCTAEPCSSRSL